MEKWDIITRSDKYKALPPEAQVEAKQRFFQRTVVPLLEKNPLLNNDTAKNAAFAKFMQSPDDTGEGIVRSTLGSAARGFGEIVPGTLQGVGALTGITPISDLGESARAGLEYIAPVNPIYEQGIPAKVANVAGNIASIIGTSGVGGLAGKVLGAERAAAAGSAAARQALTNQAIQAGAKSALYGTGFAQGAAAKAEENERLGITGTEGYLNLLGGGVSELAPEMLPFGPALESAAARRLLGGVDDAAGRVIPGIRMSAAQEAAEGGSTQVLSNLSTQLTAPTGVEAPGLFEGAGEAALWEGVGGAMFGAINKLGRTPPERQTDEQKAYAAELGAVPVDSTPPITPEESLENFNQGGIPVVSPDGVVTTLPFNREDIRATDLPFNREDIRASELPFTREDIRPTQLPFNREDIRSTELPFSQQNIRGLSQLGQPAISPSLTAAVNTADSIVTTAENTSSDVSQATTAARNIIQGVVDTPQPQVAPVQLPVEPAIELPAVTPSPAMEMPENLSQTITDSNGEIAPEMSVLPPTVQAGAGVGEAISEDGQLEPSTSIEDQKEALKDIIALKKGRGQDVAELESKLQSLGADTIPDFVEVNPETPLHPFTSEKPLLPIKVEVSDAGVRSIDSSVKQIEKLRKSLNGKLARASGANKFSIESDIYAADKALQELGRVGREIESYLKPITPQGTPTPATEGKVMPGGSAMERDVTKPEQMTPEEVFDSFNKSPSPSELARLALETNGDVGRVHPDASGSAVQLARDALKEIENIPSKDVQLFVNGASDAAVFSKEIYQSQQRVGQKGGKAALVRALSRISDTDPLDLMERIASNRELTEIINPINIALAAKKPVSAAAVDSYGIKLPQGYVKQGDLYVFSPQTTTVAKPTEGAPSQGELTLEETPKQSAGRIKKAMIRFASGMSAIGDLRKGTYARAGHKNYGVGFDVGLLSKNAINELAQIILNLKTQVFIDSGAFSNFKKAIKAPVTGKKVEPLDFDQILAKYDSIISAINQANESEETDYPRPMLVMPDVIGNQAESLVLIEKYKNWIALEVSNDTSIPIIPIPLGELSLSQAYNRILEILGSNTLGIKIDPRRFVVGVPSNAEAISRDDLAKFLSESKPPHIHFLGAAADQNINPLIDVVAENSPTTQVTADASKIRSAILSGVAKGKTRSQAIFDALYQEDDPMVILDSIKKQSTQTTASETETAASSAKEAAVASVVQQPVEGSIPTVEQESAITAIESTEKTDVAKEAMRFLEADLTDTQRAKWTPEMFTAAQAFFDSGGKDFDSLKKAIKFPRVVQQAYLKADKEAAAEQTRREAADAALAREVEKAEKEQAKLEADQKQREELGLKTLNSLIEKTRTNVVQGTVKSSDANQAVAILNKSGAIPNVLFTWIGTSKDFLADPANRVRYPETWKAVSSNPNIEGMSENGQPIVFTDNVGVSDLDRNLAKLQGTTPEVAAVRRVILHENIHKGMFFLSLKDKMKLFQFLHRLYSPEELDQLAKSYDEYSDWRTNQVSYFSIIEEAMTRDFDSMVEIPRDGIWAEFMQFLRGIWQKITGKTSEPTLKDYKDVFRLIRNSLKNSEAANADRLKNGGKTKYETNDTSVRPYASEGYGSQRMEGVSTGDNSPRAQAIRKAVSESNWNELSPTQRAKALEEFGLQSIQSRYSFDSAILPVRVTNERTPKNRPASVLSAGPSPAITIQFDTSGLADLLSGDAVTAFANVFDIAQEEVIHAAQHINIYNRWKTSKSTDSVGLYELKHYTSMINEVAKIAGDELRSGNPAVANIFTNAWNLYNPNNRAADVNDAIVKIKSAPEAAAFAMELSRMMLQMQRQDFTTETGWMRFVEAMKAMLADITNALRTALAMAKNGQVGKRLQDEISEVNALMNDLESASQPMASKVIYDSPNEAAFNSGAEVARNADYDERDKAVRSTIRAAYDLAPKPNGPSVPLDQLFDIAKQSMPDLTEGEFSQILQDLYEDSGALLQAGESPFSIFNNEGERAGSVIVMPLSGLQTRAMASIVDSPATNEFTQSVDDINNGTAKAAFSGRQFKDFKPIDRTVKSAEEYSDVAIKYVNNLEKEGVSLEDIANSVISPAFLENIGIEQDLMAQDALTIEVRQRVDNAARKEKSPGRKKQLSKLSERLSAFWQGVGSKKGQHLGQRRYLVNKARYSWMFIRELAEKAMKEARTNILISNFGSENATSFTQNSYADSDKANQQSVDENINAAEEAQEFDQDAADLAAGEATLTSTFLKLYEELKDLLREQGILSRLNAQENITAKASITPARRNELAALSKDERAKLSEKNLKRIGEILNTLLGKEADANTPEKKTVRKKREKMVEVAKKRADKGQPIDPAETANDIAIRLLNEFENKLAKSAFFNSATKPDTIVKAFREQISDPMDRKAFKDRLMAMEVTSEMADRLFDKAARTKDNAQWKRAQDMLEGPNALRNIIREINRARPSGQAPLSKQIPWRELLSQNAKTVEEYRQRIFDAISANEALKSATPDQKARLADLFAEAWEANRTRILDGMLERMIRAEEAKKNLSKEGAKALQAQRMRIVEDINLGIFDNDELAKRMAEKFGIKSEFTEMEREKINSLIEVLQDEGLNAVKRQVAAYKLLEVLQGELKIPVAKMLADFWVSSVLSGPNTIVSIGLAVASGAFELSTALSRVFIAGFTNPKQLPSELAGAYKTLARLLSAFGRQANIAWQYLVTGDPVFLDPSMNDVTENMQWGNIGKSNKLAEQMAKSDKILVKSAGLFMRTVSRLLTALDVFNSGLTKEGSLSIVFRQIGLDPEKIAALEKKSDLKPYKDAIIRKDFGGTPPKSARDKAIVDSYALADMMAELDKLGNVSENANFFGQQGAMTLDPSGLGGVGYRAIRSLVTNFESGSDRFLKKAQRGWSDSAQNGDQILSGLELAFAYALQFLAYNAANFGGVRFARFAGNKFNQGLSFIPGIGFARAFEAEFDPDRIRAKEAFIDSIQRNQLVGVMLSIGGYYILKAIADEPDDEKRGWFINGGWGNLTPEKKQQKLAAGEKEYTIGINGKVFNYANWPISSALAAIGSLSDLIRFSPDQWNDKNVAQIMASAAMSGAAAAADIPALSQFQELFGNSLSSKDPNEKRMERFAKVMSSYAGGFVPRFLKDIDYAQDPNLRKYETLWEKTASHIPVYRRYEGKEYYDILGQQIQRNIYPGSREFMVKPTDPAYKVLGALNSRGIWLTPANAEHRMVGKGARRRSLTQEEADNYSLETGKGYKQMLMRYGQRALQMPTERAKAFLLDKADDVRDKALKKVYRGYTPAS